MSESRSDELSPQRTSSAPRVELRHALHRIVVLVVDDHDDTRAMLAEYLRWHGAHTIEADGVPQAMELLRGLRIDAVVTDIAMPDEDGYSLLARMQADPACEGVRRVVVSGHSSVLEVSRRAPDATYLRKPLDLDRLLDALLAAC